MGRFSTRFPKMVKCEPRFSKNQIFAENHIKNKKIKEYFPTIDYTMITIGYTRYRFELGAPYHNLVKCLF